MWKRQRDDKLDDHWVNQDDKFDHSKKLKISDNSSEYTILSDDDTTTTCIILIDNDIHLKSTIYNLLKLKFQNQQSGKKLWLERRELQHYEYIPIEFSKDLYFVTNFIERMDENANNNGYFREGWYDIDYFEILSDELKLEFGTISNANDNIIEEEILNHLSSNYNNTTTNNINTVNEYSDPREKKCIENICLFASSKCDVESFFHEFPEMDQLFNNEEFLLKCISTNYKVFRFIEDKVNRQHDLELILKCVNVNANVLRYVESSCSIFNDKQVMMKAFPSIKMNTCFHIYYKLSTGLKNDREIALQAAEKGVSILQLINADELLNDRELVLQCVRNYGLSLKYASYNLQNDREIVFEAVRNNGCAYKYASKRLRRDRELLLLAIKTDPSALWDGPLKLRSNRQFILECVKINAFVAPPFEFDHEIINEAIKQNPFVIEQIHISKIDCKDTLLKAVELLHVKYAQDLDQYVNSLYRIHDLDVAIKLIETIPLSIHFLNEDIRQNYQELIFKSTLLHNGYWMKHSEDAFQARIIHAYNSAKIDSNYSEIRNHHNQSNLWKDMEWREWE